MSLASAYGKFKSDLRNLSKSNSENDSANMELMDRFAKIVYDFVNSAEVKAGIAVSTTGSASAQTGQTTAKGDVF